MKPRELPLFADLAEPETSGPRWKECELERRARVEAGECVVANVSIDKKEPGDIALVEWARATGRFVYIGHACRHRPELQESEWANPFIMDKDGPKPVVRDGDRPAVCAKHRALVEADPVKIARAEREFPGKVLGCWCFPEECHGNFLAELACRRVG